MPRSLCSADVGQAPASGYDLIIRRARIVDGTGAPWVRGEVAVRGDTIAAVGRTLAATAVAEIDARDQVVSPGFIDIHTHARRGIFAVPTADNYVRQGVTTVVEGNDGSSPVPLGPSLDEVAGTRISVNFATFVGQGSVRTAVLGDANRAATPDERERMRELVAQGMRDGAFGLSTGLFYVPGTFTPTAEVADLAAVAGRYGGMHISHMRCEAGKVVDSVKETIAIGELGGLPTQVTHHKVIGVPNRGKSVETLRLVAEARARGVDVTVDQYPYTASSTAISSALMPAWALEGGRAATLVRLKDPAARAKVKAETVRLLKFERGGGDPAKVGIARCEWDMTLAGKDLAQVTRRRRLEPTVENAAETVLWLIEQGGCQGIFHAIDEVDLERILAAPFTMICSDGEVCAFGKASPHPRSYGAFARVLGLYARDKALLPLEDAVRKMTSLPARRLGIEDRGILRVGMKADLAVWDPARVRDLATFDEPHQYAAGFAAVIVNGQVVFDGTTMAAAGPGRVLYGPGKTPT